MAEEDAWSESALLSFPAWSSATVKSLVPRLVEIEVAVPTVLLGSTIVVNQLCLLGLHPFLAVPRG